jgi:hypothetical protein
MNKPLNLLLVILDTVRNDALDASFVDPGRSYRAATTIAASPWTLPSCTSIMTGRRAVDHGHYWRKPRLGRNHLLESLPAGYRKVGWVNNSAVGRGSGVDNGFDRWKYSLDHDEPFERVLRAIGRLGRRPHFMVLHTNIAHDYYSPKSERYLTPELKAASPKFLRGRVITWKDTDSAMRAEAVSTYGACVSRMTDRVGAVLDAARQRDDVVTAIVADHGEGFEPDRARVHHGGRLHQDLLHVPLFFDLPTSVPAEVRDRLADALGSRVVSGTDVLPTLFDLAGHGSSTAVDGVEGRSALGTAERTLVSEDRRYLYLNDRFRFNYHGNYKNMTEEELVRNRKFTDLLAGPPTMRSFLRYPDKCTVTSLHLRTGGGTTDDRATATSLGQSLVGSPELVVSGDRLFGFERFDLASDPTEAHNLLAREGDGPAGLLGSPMGPSITMPMDGRGEVGLATLLEGSRPLGS